MTIRLIFLLSVLKDQFLQQEKSLESNQNYHVSLSKSTL